MVHMFGDNRNILFQVLAAYRRSYKIFYTIVPIVLGSFSIITLGLFIVFILILTNSKPTSTIACIIGAVSTGISFFTSTIITIRLLVKHKYYYHQLNLVFSDTTEPIIWRLDGNEWIKYLEYIFGPNRSPQFEQIFSCWFCRRKKFAQLATRGYGYIIFVENAIIIDELFIYDLNRIPITGGQLVTFANQQLVLRIYFQPNIIFKSKNNIQNNIDTMCRQVDLFVPKVLQEPQERLEQMIELISISSSNIQNIIYNFVKVRDLFQSSK
ncbi:unnamed protein product [Rotaria sp. Silwood1]|nr:unnamed protein product [Rotaria sp. Silwood1]CAF1638159.1 unnamed protein product [Rotaria sp. Silwood1]CAF3772878.1 unnamed protein product [Rotaria sp. Silwood1]CAF4768905.1 unnamed protein product [Rotaria sp. Silwood1]CAF4839624.1 unnamed protein product [Rotaria sp. Silwood1]